MALVSGEVFFAPGLRINDIDFNDPNASLAAFESRIEGLFLAPIRLLERQSETKEGALFASALLVAALIESLARVEFSRDTGHLIKDWLEAHVDDFRNVAKIGGSRFSLAAIFDDRFRNGLAHQGFVASAGRLSAEIDACVSCVDSIVTINPFLLSEIVAREFRGFCERLRSGDLDIRKFAYVIRTQFQHDIDAAKA